MSGSWYKKSMPKVGTIKPHLDDIAKHISEINGVNSVLVWGSFAKNASNPNFVLKDIDIIAVTNLFSEDLLAISKEGLNSPFSLTIAQLEEEGFEPNAVEFTNKFINLKEYNIDHWAISDDRKLLHWGPTIETKEDWEDLKKKAEAYAEQTTNVNREKLVQANQSDKNKWSIKYDHFINKYLSGIPEGWYEASCCLDDVLKETKKLI